MSEEPKKYIAKILGGGGRGGGRSLHDSVVTV